ncbi:MAG: septal ring lytic transglycosylase RlpA family protein [Gammaproteobacteria bacterium]|nr:septal ring lytic transglycosylase RlpA family protein [Gammaproteobacteria bacterium]
MNPYRHSNPSDPTYPSVTPKAVVRAFGPWVLAAFASCLTACGEIPPYGGHMFEARDSGPSQSIDLSSVRDAVPHAEPRSKYGNPETYVVDGIQYAVLKDSKGFVQTGVASWYGYKFHGRYTSSREPYDMYAMTAAHKTLPLPTYAEVRNLDNGRRVIVRINDRGPFVAGRILDLSYAAANRLGIDKTGTGRVEIRTIDPAQPPALSQPPTLVQQTKPAASALTEPKPAENGLYLQLGAYSQRDNAERAWKRIDGSFPELAGLSMSRDPATALYRVRIGPLPDQASADRIIQRLAQAGIGNIRVVAE